MKIGVSTACLYPMETEKALKILLDMGVRTLEVFLNTFSEMEAPFIRELRRQADAAGARIVSVHPFTCSFENMLFYTEYDRRTRDGFELYKKYYEAAAQLGASYLVLHGQRGYAKSSFTEEQYIERYVQLREAGLPFRVELAQENVNGYRGETVSFIKHMHETLGDACAFVFDLKQAIRAGQDPGEMLKAMGDRLVHLHLNDYTPERECLVPGCGVFDYASLFSDLKKQQYKGCGVVEVYRDNYGSPKELVDSVAFLTKLIKS